jgi:E3 ubiquitin-protein ligase SHPRH
MPYEIQAEVVEIHARSMARYRDLGPLRVVKRKRGHDEDDLPTHRAPMLKDPTYLTIADTEIKSQYEMDDSFTGFVESFVIEVVPKVKKGRVFIQTIKRGQMQEQAIGSLSITDKDSFERLNKELKVISNKSSSVTEFFRFTQKPILVVDICESTLALTLKFSFQILETLYLNYPPNVMKYIKDIICDTAEIPQHEQEAITPKLFYDAITERTQKYPEASKLPLVPELDTDLLKFQGTTVNWMLEKEHVSYSEETKSIVQVPFWTDKHFFADDEIVRQKLNELSYGFELIKIPFFDSPVWFNKYSSNLCSKETAMKYLALENTPEGRGILSEEMGLGKTVEIVALILLNSRPQNLLPEMLYDSSRDRIIPRSKTTLIICPDSILSQWYDEVSLHAPSLSVMIYNGSSKFNNRTPTEIATEMSQHDIVITSYSVISREVHNAKYNPARAKRSRRATTSRRDLGADLDNPDELDKEAVEALKEIYDDINLLTDAVEERKDYSSPLVLLEFWRMVLDEVQMMGTSASNICTIATLIPTHHCWGASGTPIKNGINDLNSLLTFMRLHPFGSINDWKALLQSSHDFKDLFANLTFRHTKAMVKNDIEIPPQQRVLLSVPFGPIEQNNYDEMFKQFLSDVGLDEMGNPIVDDWEPTPSYYETMRSWLAVLRKLCCHPSFRRESGPIGTRNFQTMDKVLERMIEEARGKCRDIDRNSITAKLEIGQIYEFTKHPRKALCVWNEACCEIETKLEELKESGLDTDAMDRGFLELLHRAYFFIGSAHYQIYTPPLSQLVAGLRADLSERHQVDEALITDEDIESENITVYRVLTKEESEHQDEERYYYSKAQEIRKKILREPIENVNKGILKLDDVAELPMVSIQRRQFEDLDIQTFIHRIDAVTVNLNQQSGILNDWISHVTRMLRTPLLDTVTDPSGEEYVASLNDQEHTSAFLAFIQRAIHDRETLVLGKPGGEYYESVSTGVFFDDECAKKLEEEYHRPTTTFSLRDLLINSKTLVSNQSFSNELRPLTDIIIRLKNVFEEQKDLCDIYKKHFRSLNNLYNMKITYFRQLQDISDNVKPFDKKTHKNYDAETNIHELSSTIRYARDDTQLIESRVRYLNSLKDDATQDDSSKMCVICRGPITIGSLTACGHQYCKDCLAEWLKKKSTCPVCKVKVKQGDVYTFTFNRPEINVRLATNNFEKNEEMYQIYHQWDQQNLQKLNEIKLRYNHGSKVNTIVRQVLWLKRRDPNVQIVIYSQWAPFLNIIGHSLKFNGVEFLGSWNALDRNGSGGKSKLRKDITTFKKDARVTCFLLNAHAEASGLNLINATHVFLCEPLVQTALELQAISRIHRIGQKKPTTVWMFTISGSVEESIVLLSTRKRLEFKEQLEEEELTKSASSLVKTQGEFVDAGDLWNSFFSHKIGRLV